MFLDRYFYVVTHVAPTHVDPDTPYPINEQDFSTDVWTCVVRNWFGFGRELAFCSCANNGWVLLTKPSRVISKELNQVLFNAVRAFLVEAKLSIRSSREKVKEFTEALVKSNELQEEVKLELPPNVILFVPKKGNLR